MEPLPSRKKMYLEYGDPIDSVVGVGLRIFFDDISSGGSSEIHRVHAVISPICPVHPERNMENHWISWFTRGIHWLTVCYKSWQ